jgi:hypothetical protein
VWPEQPGIADGRIARRKASQQARIAQGSGSGELTARETNRLEKQEGALNKEVQGERAANGGTLTPGEKAQVNRQQNRLSRRIYRQKHDSQTAQ